jgi:hypothetical protein
MPDKDFGALMKDYMGSRAETFFAVLPLALLGGGIGTYRDLKNPAMQMADRNLEFAGFGPTQRDYIAKATTPEEKAARIEQEWGKRKENDIKAGEKLYEASIAEARTPQGDTIEVNTKADGVDEWIVRDPAGKEVARVASEQEAVTIKADRGSAEIRSQANVVADLLDSDWRKDKLPNFEAQFGGEVTPEQLLKDAEAKGDTKLVEAIKASIEAHGNDPAELAKLRVLGESRITPYAEGQYKALIKLNEGYTAQDAFEELTHSIFDIDIAEGRITKEQARDWVSQTTAAGVAKYKFGNDAEVRESMAQIAQDFTRNKIDETNLPPSFVAFLKKLYTEFVEFMRRAKLLDQAFTEGKIDAEFERYLSEKIGLSDATMIEREVNRIEGEEAARSFSIRSKEEADLILGPSHPELTGKPKEAIERLIADKTGYVPGALNHPEIGPVDIIWGEKLPKKSQSYGLAKIIEWHKEAIPALENNFSESKITSRNENTIQLELNGIKFAVRKGWFGNEQHWLLTAYGQEKGESASEMIDTTSPDGGEVTQLSPQGSQDNIGQNTEDVNTSFSIRARDEAYDAAVKSGDEAEQQRLVYEAAKEAGYNVGPVYHGTNDDITSFDKKKMKEGRIGKGTYFTPNIESAENYAADSVRMKGGEASVKAYYLKDPNSYMDSIYVATDPSQIKSADPITRDDAGNVIPPSQRFNAESNDIRFSIREVASSFKSAQEFGDSLPDSSSLDERQPNQVDAPYRGAFEVGKFSIDKYGENPYIYENQYINPSDFKDVIGLEGMTWEQVVNMPTTQQYIKWYKDGNVPPPVTVVKKSGGERDGQLQTNNRRRLVAAIEAGIDRIPAVVEIGRRDDIYQESQSPSFSIQSQEQIDRVNKAVSDTTMFAEGRMALYEKAKVRFKGILAENKDILDALKEGGALPETIRRAKLLQGIAELEVILRQLPAEVRGKVGGFGVLARGGTGDTFLANFFRDRVRMIDEQLEKYLSKEYDEELYRVFERSKPKKNLPGEKPKGIGAEIQALFAELKEAQKWSPEKLEVELAKLETELTQVEDAEAYGMDEVQAKAKEEARILQSINLLSKVGGWNPKYAEKVKADGKVSIVKVYNGKTSNEKADAIRALKAAWARGYYEFQMKKIKEREEREGIQSNMKDSTNKAGTDAERIQKRLSEMGMAAGWGKSIYDLSSFDQVVNLIFGDNSEIANELSDIQRKTENQKEDALQRKYEEVEDLFTKLAGGSTLKGKQLQYDMMQPSIKFTEGAYKGIELSQMQAISDIMMWNQEDGKRHMEGRYDENGRPISKWHYTQEFIDYLEKSITKEGRAVMDFLLTKYAEEHPEINKVYKPLNGVSLISIENYAPLSVVPQQQKSGQMVDPTTGQSFSSASITPRSLLTRGTSIAQPDITVDAVQKYLSHTRQMEHWKAFAPVMAKYGTALRNRDVLDSIEAKAGKAGRTAITNWLDYMTNGGVREAGASLWTNKMANDVMGRAAQVALFGRVGTILLQGTQLAAASAVMPHGAYMMRLTKLLTGNLDWAAATKSDYIQRRIKQMPVVEQQAMQELATARPSRVIEIQRLLGASLSTADGFFTGGTFAMVYDYQLSQAKENGMTGKEAENFALNEAERITDRIAQPTRPGARSMWELTATSPASRLAFSFASEPRKNLALLLYAKKTDGVLSARFWRAATYTIFLSGVLSALARNAWKDMKDESDDEWFDEKHWGWKRLSLMAITDPANGIPLVGSSIQEAALHLGGVYYQNDNLMSLNKGTSTARQLPKYWEGDWTADQVMRDVDTIFSVAGMANQNMAAYSSLSHLARDVFGVAKNTKKAVEGQ